MKFPPNNSIAGLVCAGVLLLAAIPAQGAGVTVVTHGFQASGGGPPWVDAMGAAVAARAGQSAAIINMEVGILTNGSLGILNMNLQGGNLPVAGSTNAEVIIKLFWNTVAGFDDTETATDIANQAVPRLLTSINWGGAGTTSPFAELPIHLIGHSRGSSVVTEMSRLLAQRGVWVDHVTLLDPHPLTSSDPFTSAIDPAVAIYDNVLFADNFYQLLFYPQGQSVSGTTALLLNSRFLNDDFSEFEDHSRVHDWYHGTIDTNATSVAGEEIPRADWYVAGDVGFQYSLMAGGTYTGGTRATNNAGLRFAGSPRVSVPRTVAGADIWDNVAITNFAGDITVIQGNPLVVGAHFEDTNLDATIQIGLDANSNPYDGTMGSPLFTTNTSALVGNAVQTSLATGSLAPGTYGVFAKISNSAHTRYYVTRGRVKVLQQLGATLQPPIRTTNGTVTVNLFGQTGGTYVMQASADLTNWVSLGTNTLTVSPWQFIETPPPIPAQRFYRAYLVFQ